MVGWYLEAPPGSKVGDDAHTEPFYYGGYECADLARYLCLSCVV